MVALMVIGLWDECIDGELLDEVFDVVGAILQCLDELVELKEVEDSDVFVQKGQANVVPRTTDAQKGLFLPKHAVPVGVGAERC